MARDGELFDASWSHPGIEMQARLASQTQADPDAECEHEIGDPSGLARSSLKHHAAQGVADIEAEKKSQALAS